jgi:hypothetical protein
MVDGTVDRSSRVRTTKMADINELLLPPIISGNRSFKAIASRSPSDEGIRAKYASFQVHGTSEGPLADRRGHGKATLGI